MDALSHSKFPIRACHPQIRIDSDTVRAWTDKARHEVQAVLGNRNSWYYRFNDIKMNMKLTYDKQQVRGYYSNLFNVSAPPNERQQHRNSECSAPFSEQNASDCKKTTQKIAFLCEAQLDVSDLNKLACSLYSDTTADFRSVCACLYQEQFLDSAVLHVAEKRNKKDAFLFSGIRYIAFYPSLSGFSAARDILMLEVSGTSVDCNGRKVLFQYLESKRLLSNELQYADNGIARCQISHRSFYWEDNGAVAHVSRGEADRSSDGYMPTWIYVRNVARPFSIIYNINKLVDTRALIPAVKANCLDVVENDNKQCRVCKKKFTIIRLRYICRTCGKSICRRCTVSLKLLNDSKKYSPVASVISEKFCLGCVVQARNAKAYSTQAVQCISEQSIAPIQKNSDHKPLSRLDGALAFQVSSKIAQPLFDIDTKSSSCSERRQRRSSDSELFQSGIFKAFQEECDTHCQKSWNNDDCDSTFSALTEGMLAIDKMSKSIAQQEAILMSMQAEHARRQGRTPSYRMQARSAPGYLSALGRRHSSTSFIESDRFEVLP